MSFCWLPVGLRGNCQGNSFPVVDDGLIFSSAHILVTTLSSSNVPSSEPCRPTTPFPRQNWCRVERGGLRTDGGIVEPKISFPTMAGSKRVKEINRGVFSSQIFFCLVSTSLLLFRNGYVEGKVSALAKVPYPQ